MSSVAGGLVASLVDAPNGLSEFIRLGLTAELFKGPEEQAAYNLLADYVAKYGAIPNRKRFEEVGILLPLAHPDPLDYYVDQIRTRFIHQSLKQTVLDVQEALNGDNPGLGKDLMQHTVLKLLRATSARKMVDFAHQGHEIIAKELHNKKTQGDDYGVKFGWPTLDGMADGLGGGDVVTVVGRPGQGKTYVMLGTASYAWLHQKKKPAFFSMEMKLLPLAQRLAAMNTHKSITQLKKAELSSMAEKDMLLKLKSFESEKEFWLIDGNLTATVDDIILMCRQLKPDVVWIDGAYLVRGGSQQQRWDRVTYVLERIKSDLAEAMDIPAVISFQFNRQQKKGHDGDLANIAYTDAVGQLSSVILGLGLADDEGSVESIHRRKVQVLKGRNGEVGEFYINWNFDQGPNFMDFSEIGVADQGDMVHGVE